MTAIRDFQAAHHLLQLGHRMQQAAVQRGVVDGQGVALVVRHQRHHRAELQGLHKAVQALRIVEDLDQLVAAAFPG